MLWRLSGSRSPDWQDAERSHARARPGSICPSLGILLNWTQPASVDLSLITHGPDVGVNVVRREGDVAVVVVK